MNAGKTLQELAIEVQRQKTSKRDFIATTTELGVYTPNRGEYGIGETVLDLPKIGNFPINPYTHNQLATHLGIPKTYYDRLRTSVPDLFDTNVNTLLRMTPPDKSGRPERRFVRTLDGRVRAFLSDTYRPIDNSAMIDPLLEELSTYPGLQIDSSQITETRFYLKVSSPRLMGEVKVGDEVQLGLLIQNSEVGRGRWKSMPFIKRLVCINGMIMEEYSQQRNHSGRRLGYGGGSEFEPEDAMAYFSDETLEAENHAFFLRVRDSMREIMSGNVLNRLLEKMRFAAGVTLQNPEAAIEVVSAKASLNEEEQSGILRHLIEGGDLSMWGFANAITAAADSATHDYDRNTELQVLGGRIIDLDKTEWREIVEAKPSGKRARTSSLATVATV